jgi:hypothetical protein
LSCSTTPITAKFSGTPDGSGYVLVDNYLTLAVGGAAVGTGSPAGNVCQGGVTDSFNNTTQQDCFSQAYRNAAVNNSILTDNTDSLTNPGNSVLPNGSAGGVPPIDISADLGSSGTPNTSITLLDAGGFVASSSLFLVTNCSPAGIAPGGTVTGNPVTTDPNTQTQTLTFDANPGENISYTTSTVNSGVIALGVTPVVKDFGISQTDFSNLIKNTSAAPAVCLRLTGETDSMGNTLCKGFLIQCFDPSKSTTTGDNCTTGAAATRTLYDAAQFTSKDAPSGTDFLGSSCQNFVQTVTLTITNGTCAPSMPPGTSNTPTLIGPGILLGSDDWITSGNCVLTGTLLKDLCPLDTLTQFVGAADPTAGSTTKGKNSLFVPVMNMPLPYTTIVSTNLTNGWSTTGQATINFSSNQATYLGGSSNPGSNGFVSAPPYSLTYGITPAGSPVPDTTFPVAGDTTNFNAGVNHASAAQICPAGSAPNPFLSNAMFTEPEGIYNVHYFTTDCAFTEELLFKAVITDKSANWASFEVFTFGVDNEAPMLACTTTPSSPNGSNGWYTSNAAESCTGSDPNFTATTGSGFAPPVNGIQGSPTKSIGPLSTGVGAGAANAAVVIPQQQVVDLAGNSSNIVPTMTFPVDQALPTISSSINGQTFNVGSSVMSTYSCTDLGSGIATCGGQAPASCPAAPNAGPLSYVTPGTPVDTSAGAIGTHTFTVTATDCAGNNSAALTVSYTVGAASASVLFGPLPTIAVPGKTLQYYVALVDTNPAKNPAPVYGANISVQLQMPSSTLSGSSSALFADVTCTSFPCSVTPSSGASCSVSTSTAGSTTTVSVNCSNVGTVTDLFTSKSGVVVRISLPISSKAPAGKAITASGIVTAASPITGTTSFKNVQTVIF